VTDTTDAVGDDARPRHARRRLALVVVAFLIALTAATAVTSTPVLRNCNTKILGAPGDATAGGVWTAWNYEELSGSPWPAQTPYTAAPEGEAFWQPQFVTAVGLLTPLWAFTQVTSPTCAWNLTVLSGFVLSGMAMFALAYWLTRSPWAAGFAGFAYAMSPYRQYKAEGHLAYVHTELFPILLLALLWFWQRPSARRAVVVAVALAALAYTDGYFILLGWATFGLFSLGALLYRWRRPAADVRLGRTLALTALAAVVAVVLMAPMAAAVRSEGDRIGSSLQRPIDDLYTFSARPWNYVMPPRSHPVFDDAFGPWQDARLRGSNYSEQSLYLGWTVIVLAGAAAVVAWRRRRQADDEDADVARGLPLGLIMAGLAAVVVGALVMSSPPVAHLGPLALPAPSNLIYRVVKLWRVYARFFVVVHAGLVALAALGLAALLHKRRPRLQAAIAIGLVSLLGFEYLTFPPKVAWSYELVPGVYGWLREQRDVDIVAEYPLYTTSMDPDHALLTFQPIHEKRLLNARNEPSPQDALRRPLFGLANPQTLPVLRRLGVDLVLMHPGMDAAPTGEARPPGLEPYATFRYEADQRTRPDGRRLQRYAYLTPFFDVDVYRVGPGPMADVAVALNDGFYSPERLEWRSFQWMESTGHIEVRRLAGTAARATVSFDVSPAFRTPRRLVARQHGRVVWDGMVASEAAVRFVADVEEPIELTTEPGAVVVRDHDPGSADIRPISLMVTNLVAEPV